MYACTVCILSLAQHLVSFLMLHCLSAICYSENCIYRLIVVPNMKHTENYVYSIQYKYLRGVVGNITSYIPTQEIIARYMRGGNKVYMCLYDLDAYGKSI